MKGSQKLKLKQQTAYDKKVTHELFEISMEWLEKYIEIAYKKEFPDWEKRKQIHDNNIKRQDIYGNPEIAEETLSTQLLLFQSTAKDKSPAIRDEIKEEYYRWMNAVGINVNNCPKRLKNFLFGINEILEGRGEKVLMDAIYRKETIDSNSAEYMEQMMSLYANTQQVSREEIEIEKSLRGKTDKDWKIKNKFGSGDTEQGKQQFDKIAGEIAGEHDKFHFYPQKSQQNLDPQHPTNPNEVVQEVKTNPINWTLDEITTEVNSDFSRTTKKQEFVLYCRHARFDDYDQEGKLNFNNNPIYLWENFNSQQRFEIKKVKNISGDYLTNEEIDWVAKEVISNPGIWRIGVEKGQTYLIHNSAQGNDDKEFGTLIHSKQKFNDLGWVKIEKAIIIESVKNDVGNWEIRENAPLSHYFHGAVKSRGNVLIRKEVVLGDRDYDQAKELVNQPGKIYRADYFNEKEQAEIGKAFAKFAVICNIRQHPNSFSLQNVPFLNKENGYEEQEEWIIDNRVINNPAERKTDDMGYLVFDANKMVKVKDLNEAEKQAINYNKSQQGLQYSSLAPEQNDDNKISTGKVFGIIGVISVLLITSLAILRKRLNNKGKE